MMNKRFNNYAFIFHATIENKKFIDNVIKVNNLENTQSLKNDINL